MNDEIRKLATEMVRLRDHMRKVADMMRDVQGSPEFRRHAHELYGAADMVEEWASVIVKEAEDVEKGMEA